MRIDRLPFAAAPIVLLALALSTAGCGTSLLQPKSQPDSTEIRQLQERILELQRHSAVQTVELARLRERVAELEAREGIATVRRRRTEPTVPSTRQPDGERPPSGERVVGGEPQPSTAQLRDSPDLEVTEILEEDVAAAPTAPLPSSDVRSAAVPGAASAASSPPPSAAARIEYDRAYTLFHQGRFAEAETAFRRFLQAHPNNDHADNAQYWIGESRYSRDDFSGALDAFRETVERFPGGNKVPDALLKAGQSLEKLGDSQGARETYLEIARRYPDSAAAAVSQQRLAGLP